MVPSPARASDTRCTTSLGRTSGAATQGGFACAAAAAAAGRDRHVRPWQLQLLQPYTKHLGTWG